MAKSHKKVILAVALSSVVAIGGVATALIVTGMNKKADVPIENAGQSTVLETDKSPAELTPREVAYAYIYKQGHFSSYKLQSSGQTVADILGGYVQEVGDVGYKFGDEIYMRNVSTSKFATVDHEAFVKTVDGVCKVAYRDKGGEISVSERDGEKGYKSVYGISPDDNAIGGYIINDNTLKVAEHLTGEGRYAYKEEYAGDLQYHFSIELGDKAVHDEATAYAQLQMAEYGGLSAAPEFGSIDLYLTISEDWKPRELITHAVYGAEKNIGMSMSFTCTQDITAVYTDVDALTENPIPDTDKFNGAIGSQPATEAQGGDAAALSGEMTALMDVFNALAGQNWERGVKLGLSLDLGMFSREDDQLLNVVSAPFTADVYAKYNPSAIDSGAYLNAVNFRLDADLTGLQDILKLLEIAPEGSVPAYLTRMSGVSLCYTGNGYPAAVIKNEEGEFMHAAEIDLAGMILPYLGSESGGTGLSDLDVGKIVDFINNSFTLENREGGRALVLSGGAVEKLDGGYADIVEKLATLAGEASGDGLGSLADAAIRRYLGAEITGLEIMINDGEGGVTGLSVSIYGRPYCNFPADGAPISLISLSLGIAGDMSEGEIASLEGDGEWVKEILAKEKTAETYRAKVQTLIDGMWLGETYVRRVKAVKEEIEALPSDVKSLVFNSGKLDGCIEKHNDYLADAEDFLQLYDRLIEEGEGFEQWADINKLYDGKIEFVACQREYIGEEILGGYLEKRKAV